MADPLSISASVVGLVVPALEGTRLLIENVRNIKDAPKALKDVEADLKSVEASLESLADLDASQMSQLPERVNEQCGDTISRYSSVCSDFRADLARYTRRSRDGKLSWRDKLNVGFFSKQRISGMARQLKSCKLTINSVVGIATLCNTGRNIANTEEIKKLLSAKQTEMTGSIALVDSQIVQAELSLVRMDQDQQDGLNQEDEEDMDSATWAIEEEVKMLRSSQETMKELLSSIQAQLSQSTAGAVSNVSTNVSFGMNNSGFQVGTSSGSISGMSFGTR